MLVDTSKTYEFKAIDPRIVRDRLWNSIALGVAALALSGAAIWAGPEWFLGVFDRRAGLLYLCFSLGFPFISLLLFWHGFTEYRRDRTTAGQSLVVVDEHGVWDKRLLHSALAWASIKSVRLSGSVGNRSVELALSEGYAVDWDDAKIAKRKLNKDAKKLELAAKGLVPAFPAMDDVVLAFWKKMHGAMHAL